MCFVVVAVVLYYLKNCLQINLHSRVLFGGMLVELSWPTLFPFLRSPLVLSRSVSASGRSCRDIRKQLRKTSAGGRDIEVTKGVQVEETTVGNRRSVPRLGLISLHALWYAFLLCGHSLPSVNSRTIVMCLYLGVGSSRGERDRTHW